MNEVPAVDQRLLRGVAGTLSWTNLDSVGTAAAATGAVTVGVTHGDGSALVAAGGATSGTNPYTKTLAGSQITDLDLLTASWLDAGTGATHTTLCEICGGFFFSIAQFRASDSKLADTTKYPDANVLASRLEVELEFELICDRAFVPRYRRDILDGSGTEELILSGKDLRRIRSVRTYSTPTAYTAFTAAQLAALVVSPDGRVRRSDNDVFVDGIGNIVVEYEYGLDRLPLDLLPHAIARCRMRLNQPTSGIPDRADRFIAGDGRTYILDLPGTWEIGVPEIDAALSKHSLRQRGKNGAVPASRTLEYAPSRFSMFHGGRL